MAIDHRTTSLFRRVAGLADGLGHSAVFSAGGVTVGVVWLWLARDGWIGPLLAAAGAFALLCLGAWARRQASSIRSDMAEQVGRDSARTDA